MSCRKDFTEKLAVLKQANHGRESRQYWRSLEELGDTAEFQDLMRQEFPGWPVYGPTALIAAAS